ncbi:hypothetical protein N7478_002469 [Penicillium angulare]|uniref:uncharacterized protein n=1 Tax=Penicillium angulare TaxID=116970 RepID=UPI0025413E33|nr:uncharacterized protein N7478_002469 [Penicillium angulare]KAJ5286783.1 hypothetical protein N7478_002469 [Penicillium angulare]
MATFTPKIIDTGWGQPTPATSATISKKKVRTRQTGTAWTRSGCLTCKKRRKGCDKAKPSCNNCIKQGRVCEGYGSLWVEPLGPSTQTFHSDSVKSGQKTDYPPSHLLSPSLSPQIGIWLNVQPSLVSTSPSESVHSSSPHNLSDDSTLPYQSEGTETIDPNAELLQQSLAAVPRPRNFIRHLSNHESHYIQYHVQHGSRLLANLESEDNPLRSLLIPRAMSSPLLMKAVCAVSALHLANRTQTYTAQTASVNYYGRALNELRSVIVGPSPEALSDDTMIAVGLLCKYEIVRGSVKQWVVHLNALQRLIANRGGLRSMDEDAAYFLRGLYLYAYNMARISNRKRITAFEACPADTELGMPKLDIYIGYTEEILKICSRIAELPSLEGDMASMRLAVASINESLLTWSHASCPYIIPKGHSPESLSRLQLVAECYRDAAFVYLHSILERMSMKLTSHTAAAEQDTGNSSYLNDLTTLIFTPKATAVHRCLARVETFSLDNHVEYSALTFPLFIAGAESSVLEHRDLVMHSLGNLQVNFGIGNVKRAKELLELLWARKDANLFNEIGNADSTFIVQNAHWQDILEELQWDVILA